MVNPKREERRQNLQYSASEHDATDVDTVRRTDQLRSHSYLSHVFYLSLFTSAASAAQRREEAQAVVEEASKQASRHLQHRQQQYQQHMYRRFLMMDKTVLRRVST